ncbi:FtsQ-type POTRA domain-containing protein [Homoserinibacter sp. GY 40078]|uniref:FtsQ-type POTRA domain-containing protein n=1 Tax=Homoserinibacter sp. GY 40078 TaxID=2603275 RepID=UPI0016508CC7|nr:FtsQ-type POTRA domain-containing protein [Homoserinibacter sp. GY 40078]
MSRFTRRARRRRVAWATGLGLVAMLVGLSFGAVYSPLLALRDIQIEGTSRLDPAQLVDAIDGQMGVPLALLDEGRIRDELGKFTLIRSYSIELLPPGTLLVEVTERTPLGTIARADGSFDLVDAAGVVIQNTPKKASGMPVVKVPDDDVTSAAFASAAQVILALPDSVREKVTQVTASTRDDVTLTLAKSKQTVVWGGAESSEHKGRVLAALIKIHGGSGPGEYDVSAPGTAVFRSR